MSGAVAKLVIVAYFSRCFQVMFVILLSAMLNSNFRSNLQIREASLESRQKSRLALVMMIEN